MNNENEKIEEEKVLEIYETENNKRYKKSILFFIISIIILVFSATTYNNHFIQNNKYAFKFNDVKIERSIVEKLKDNFTSEEEIAYFIMDTLTYSKIAEERGITVSEEEIKKVNEEFPVYQKEIALSNKLIDEVSKKTENLTEKELKEFYEETKDTYVKKGTVKFLGITSKDLIDPDLQLTEEEVAKYPKNEEKIEQLLENGLVPNDLQLNKFILVDISDENEEETYRYIYIYEKNVTEYYNFEDSKEYLKTQYDRLYGASSLLEAASAVQQNTTIEYFN